MLWASLSGRQKEECYERAINEKKFLLVFAGCGILQYGESYAT
jgi:hypothetical protein